MYKSETKTAINGKRHPYVNRNGWEMNETESKTISFYPGYEIAAQVIKVRIAQNITTVK